MRISFVIFLGLFVICCSNGAKMGDVRNGSGNLEPQHATASDEISAEKNTWPATFGFGKRASEKDIKRLDIDIMPDGRGLPEGNGLAAKGRPIYLAKCASCHGQHGEGEPYDVLVSDTRKSIGTYWPYATTVFDYVRRAMPFDQPGSLTDEEVYHLTAYLLAANGIIDSAQTLDRKRLSAIEMPAKERFVLDDRKGGPEIR